MSSFSTIHDQIANNYSVFHLSHTPSFLLSGEEVRRWCNGMFSNNVRALPIHKGNRSAICNPKGHVQGLLDLYCLGDELFLVILDGLSQQDFQKKFAPFMMLDDIELEEVHAELISIQGPNAAEMLSKLNITVPDDQDIHTISNGYVVRKDRFGARRASHGFEIITTQLPSVKNEIQKITRIFSCQDFEHHRILSQQARFPDDIGERAFLHELGINEECCSFNKGCYVGQEIINRMDVKGLVNKKLYLYQSDAAFAVGEDVVLNDKKVGVVRSTCQIQDKHYALIMTRKKAWNLDVHSQKSIATSITPLY